MKRPSWLVGAMAFAISTFVAVNARALDIKSETAQTSNYLSASGEISQFTLPTGSIHGNGLRVDFTHYFSNTANFDIYLGTALNSQSAGSSSFTGLGGYFYYTLWGACCSLKKTVSSGGMPVLVESQTRRNSFSMGLGLDQYFLNGSTAVFSVSGVGAGAKYQFGLFNYNFEAAARYSFMSASGGDIQALFLSVGMVFAL